MAALMSTYAEAPLLRAKVATLEADLAVKDRTIAAQGQLLDLADKITASEHRLRELAEQESGVYAKKAERIEAEREKETRWLRCQRNALAGAALGGAAGAAAMGVGALPGAALGGIVGCVSGFFGLP